MTVIAAQDPQILISYNSENLTIPLILTPNSNSSRLLSGASPLLLNFLTNENSTFNVHEYGVDPAAYTFNTDLEQMFSLLSVSLDRDGLPFASTMEARNYPFYATQWYIK
jgi:hypothetical protein